MRHIFFFAFFLAYANFANAQLWNSNFPGTNNGAQSGTAGGTLNGSWSVTTDPSGTFNIDGNNFGINNTDSEGRLASNVMTITSVGYAIIDVRYGSAGLGFSSSDYIRFYYRVDGGPEILFANVQGDLLDLGSAQASAIVAGNTLQIIVRAMDNSSFIFFGGQMWIEEITVTAAPKIFSRGSGGWRDASRWSLNGHSGAACLCYPLNSQVAVIGEGHNVTISNSQTSVSNTASSGLAPGAVDVFGTLQFTANNVALGIQKGLLRVRGTGAINASNPGITGSQIQFQANLGGAALTIDAGATVSVANLTLTSSATNYHFLNGGGTLGISGNILVSAQGATLTNDLSTPFSVGGNVSISQSSFLINNENITLPSTAAGVINGSGTWTQGVNSTLNYAGSNLSIGTFNASASGNLVNYNRNGDQTIDAPSGNTYHHITLQGSGTKASSSNLDINGDLTVAGSARLDVNSGNDDINLAGDWSVTSTNSDPFIQGSRTVTLDGSSPQSLSTVLAAGETFYRLRLFNSSASKPQFTFHDNLTVTSVLDMDDGIVNLMGNTITLSNNAAGALDHNGNDSNGWMYGGSFARSRPGSDGITAGSVHSLFPLGSYADWRPFYAGQNDNSGTVGVMTVNHTNSTSTSDVSITDNTLAPTRTIVKRHNSFWSPSTTATGGTYTLRAGGTNFGIIANSGDIRMATSTGITGTHSASSGNAATSWLVNRTGVSRANLNANNFHLASTNAGASPLPIELLSFSARIDNNEVDLKWSTASELNNNFFTIERASNLEEFESLIDVDGKGTTKELSHYQIVDPSPLYGRSYYRLKQTDFDGQFTYSSVQVIDYAGPAYATLSASPNPLKVSSLTVRIDGLKETRLVPIQILNIHGQKVFEKVFEVKTPGTLTAELPRNTFPTSGLYIIKAGESVYLTKKIVVE
jgi:hypothetical protein